MTNLQVGIAGAGNIATSRHLPAYRNDDRVTLAAIYDTNVKKARSVGREYGIPSVSSFEELCDRADLLSLCTPPSVHCEQAVTAMEAGCHVLTEKPMAMSIGEANQMIDTAEKTDRVLSVVHNFLFMKSMREARNLVADGAVGDVVRTQAFLIKNEGQGKEYVRAAEEQGNAGIRFWDEAPHMMYLTRAFIGEMSLRNADATAHSSGPGYRSVRARFDGEQEALGGISFMWDAPLSEWWLVIFGDDGLLAVDIYRDLLLQFDAENEHSAIRVISLLLRGVGQATLGGFMAGVRYLRDRFVEGYRIPDAGFSYQIHRIVDAVLKDEVPPVTGTESREVLADMAIIGDATGMSLDLDSNTDTT